MEVLNDFWPYFENIGVPTLMISLGITLFTLNFYGIQCFKLSKMKDDIDSKKYGNKNLESKNYERSDNYFSLIYIFLSIPTKGTPYYEDDVFNNQINIIKRWKRFYLIIFLLTIPFLIIGAFINETIMN